MIKDPFEQPGVDTSPEALAKLWADLLNDARSSNRLVAVRLTSGDVYPGRVLAVGSVSADLEQPKPDSGKTYGHTVALTAIIAITFEVDADS
jgi:hypothetical protein